MYNVLSTKYGICQGNAFIHGGVVKEEKFNQGVGVSVSEIRYLAFCKKLAAVLDLFPFPNKKGYLLY